MALDQDLRRAVQRRELTLRYQPQISMRTGQVIGIEALLRWQHGGKGLLGADEVIPMAEKNGLILEMASGPWARRCGRPRSGWRRACRRYASPSTSQPCRCSEGVSCTP